MTKSQKGLLAAIIGNFIFGFSFLFSEEAFSVVSDCFQGKNVVSGADVPVVLAIRFTAAFLFMTAVIPFLKIKVNIKGKPVYKLVVLGILQPIIYFIGESFGIKMTNGIISSVIIGTVPVAAQFFSALFLKEKPTKAQVFFCFLSVLGIIIMTFFSGGDNKKTYLLGIFCLLIAVFSAVGFNVLGRECSKDFTPFERTYFMFLLGAIFFFIYALIYTKGSMSIIVSPLQKPSFVVSILYLSGLSSVLAYLFINYANTYLPITQTTAFANIIPVVSTVAGFIIRGYFDWFLAVSCAVIILGVYGVQKFKK